MPAWLPDALMGLAFGLAVSGVNHLIFLRGIRKSDGMPDMKAKNIIAAHYGVRYILDFTALFLVYFFNKSMAALITTAFGLTASKNVLFFKYLRQDSGKKGVS